MKQKLAIACGLLHAPRVILFDEPLTGLDPIGIRRMKASILRRAKDGAAIIISSHLLPLLEEVCSHVLILGGGKVLANGHLRGSRATVLGRRRRGPAGPGRNLLPRNGEPKAKLAHPIGSQIAAPASRILADVFALFFLQWHSFRNRLWQRVRRLRNPRYLFGR